MLIIIHCHDSSKTFVKNSFVEFFFEKNKISTKNENKNQTRAKSRSFTGLQNPVENYQQKPTGFTP